MWDYLRKPKSPSLTVPFRRKVFFLPPQRSYLGNLWNLYDLGGQWEPQSSRLPLYSGSAPKCTHSFSFQESFLPAFLQPPGWSRVFLLVPFSFPWLFWSSLDLPGADTDKSVGFLAGEFSLVPSCGLTHSLAQRGRGSPFALVWDWAEGQGRSSDCQKVFLWFQDRKRNRFWSLPSVEWCPVSWFSTQTED